MRSNPDRKQRINVTLHPTTLAALEEQIPEKQRSAWLEALARKELGLSPLGEKAISRQSEKTSEIGLKTP